MYDHSFFRYLVVLSKNHVFKNIQGPYDVIKIADVGIFIILIDIFDFRQNECFNALYLFFNVKK